MLEVPKWSPHTPEKALEPAGGSPPWLLSGVGGADVLCGACPVVRALLSSSPGPCRLLSARRGLPVCAGGGLPRVRRKPSGQPLRGSKSAPRASRHSVQTLLIEAPVAALPQARPRPSHSWQLSSAVFALGRRSSSPPVPPLPSDADAENSPLSLCSHHGHVWFPSASPGLSPSLSQAVHASESTASLHGAVVRVESSLELDVLGPEGL